LASYIAVSEDLLDALQEDVKTWNYSAKELAKLTATYYYAEHRFNKKLELWLQQHQPPPKCKRVRKKKLQAADAAT
jgi:hypothetical protein